MLLVFTCSMGFICGKREGLLTGVLSGFLLDCVFGTTVGFYSLIYMYLGYGCGIFNHILYTENIITPLIMTGICDFLYGCYIFVFKFALRNRLDFGYYFRSIILPEMIYSVVVAMFLFGVLLFLVRALEKAERRRAESFV